MTKQDQLYAELSRKILETYAYILTKKEEVDKEVKVTRERFREAKP